jgi:serine/threonine protein kinase/tetratricopeptide (TPR) repeat protein
MICPRCGKTIARSAAPCPWCATGVATGLLTPPPPSTTARADAGPADAPTIVGGAEAPTILSMPENGATTLRPVEPPTVRSPAAPTEFAAGDLPTGAHALAGGETALSLGGGSPSDHGPLSVGQVFGTRYHIIKLLGVGGMGAVYQAWDEELAVAVAIKVIRPEVMADPVAAADIERRFKRELLLAREVTHRNVVRIHDLGEIDGIKYITMAYVNGADLATLIRREGRVPPAKALRIARSVVSGLVAAHAANVVHRDLKPANVMVDAQDEALIMDFGIARSTADPVTKSAAADSKRAAPAARPFSKYTDATAVGSIVGTVEYMAPEQAKGLEVDQRADVYAFGLILYDMLTGRRRAELASSAFSELQARMEQPLPPVRSIVPEVASALDRLVSRCIEPDREKRFQSTAALAAELDRLDENGEPIPIKRVVGMRMVAAIIVVLLGVSVGTWSYLRQLIPPAQHDPVSVVIADLQNNTGDATFDRTLEPMLKRALEDAGFISAFDRNGITRTLGVRSPENLDEAAAREIAVKQGLGVVLSGSIDRQGSGYGISIKAVQTVTGNVITSTKARATNKEQVLGVATRLVATVRMALGDETSESTQIFAMASLSATSLDVVRHYAAAMEAASRNKFDEALQGAAKAVELDPKFGIGYQVLASVSKGLGKQQDAEKYINEALRYLDGMTERERFSTRGMFYLITGDYQQCVKEYGDLIGRYAADIVARNQLALCSSQLRDLRKAQDEMRRVVELLPKRTLFRDNLALYANYAGDFQTGEQQARTIEEVDAYASLALAFAQLGQGQISEANETYKKLAAIDSLGASFASSGLGDLAIYQGRFSDAMRILDEGAVSDLKAQNPDRAAAKFAALANAHLLRGQKGPAVVAAEKALQNSKSVSVRFLAARLFVDAGEIAKARALMAGLGAELLAEPQAYAKIIEGQIALRTKDVRQAIKLLSDANGVLDTWIGHFELGRAFLEGRQFIQADSEFDRCIKRRGEALSLFLDEEPTYAYFPGVYYYQGRVREELKNAGFADSYRAYLAIRGESSEDPLLPEIRRRVGG